MCHPPSAPRAGSTLPLCTSNKGTHGSSLGCPQTQPLAGKGWLLPSFICRPRLSSREEHSPRRHPTTLRGASRASSKGRFFPCALIPWGPVAAGPARCPGLLSHSAALSHHLPPGRLLVAATNIRGRNVLQHLGLAAWLISLRRLWLLCLLRFRRGAKARPTLVCLSVNQE